MSTISVQQRFKTAFEEQARECKAQRMAEYFARALIGTVMEQSQEDWKQAAGAAGVNYPSPESQARIVEILRSMRPVMKGWQL